MIFRNFLGDIRGALNSLEFSLLNNQSDTTLASSAYHFDYFHFIGKILYSKRAETASDEWSKCESLLLPDVAQKW
jgi:hypothetical protein